MMPIEQRIDGFTASSFIEEIVNVAVNVSYYNMKDLLFVDYVFFSSVEVYSLLFLKNCPSLQADGKLDIILKQT